MNRRPLALTVFACSMVGIAFSIPIQAGLLQDFEHITANLTWLNILVMSLCISLAWATLQAHWSVRILLPLTFATVVFNNWWVGFVALDFNLLQTSLASLGFVALSGMLLEKKALEVLKNPSLKWWNRAPRNQVAVPVILSPWLRGPTLHKQSFDLSDTGLFVQGLQGDEFTSLNLGERFEARLDLVGQAEIHCTVRVVRKTKGAGMYPAGIGLTFEGLTPHEKSTLQRFRRNAPEPLAFH